MKEQLIAIFSFALILAIDVFISISIVRVIAIFFAEPNSYSWEFAYVSESPNATKYHESRDCKYLKQTSYKIELMSVEEAEDEELQPCKHCLKTSVSKQFDEYSALLMLPVFCLLLWGLEKIDKLLKEYTLRNPIVKKSRKKTR